MSWNLENILNPIFSKSNLTLSLTLKTNPQPFTCLQDIYCQFFRALLEASCQIRLRPYQKEPVFDEIAPKFRFALFWTRQCLFEAGSLRKLVLLDFRI